ncbi:hypothetical protein [Butyrivibrio sp. INlla14]|uniref:hypothetical protein n=1 Tax=Butyrivibrio sp. INlla14 TaxID=1520808 RepID=UPI0015A323B8|nr:hypothetical protein [Butyrivibrio sp. INlla14]
MRRATHEELGLFTWDEAATAFTGIFSKIRGLSVNAKIIEELNEASYGHPLAMVIRILCSFWAIILFCI